MNRGAETKLAKMDPMDYAGLLEARLAAGD